MKRIGLALSFGRQRQSRATRSGKKGDLSRFVEEAVNREVLCETIRDVQARNNDIDPDELDRLVDEELNAARH